MLARLGLLAAHANDHAEGPVGGSAFLPSVAGVVVAALIAAFVKLWADKRSRRVTSQRESLYGLQQAVHQYRLMLVKHGESILDEGQEAELALAETSLTIARARSRSAEVRYAVKKWREAAELYWPGADEGTATSEDSAWKRVQIAIGTELRKYDA